jgi:hypothetical protein
MPRLGHFEAIKKRGQPGGGASPLVQDGTAGAGPLRARRLRRALQHQPGGAVEFRVPFR